MPLSESRVVAAPLDAVWAGLNDPAVLGACIPGCESFTRSGPNEMTAVVAIKLGPLKARFRGTVTVSDVDAPTRCRLTAQGGGGLAGFAKGGATVKLSPAGPQATRVDYAADAEVGGRLKLLASKLVDGAAQRLADGFFARFAAQVG